VQNYFINFSLQKGRGAERVAEAVELKTEASFSRRGGGDKLFFES